MEIKSTFTNPLKFYSVINFWFIVSTIDNIFLNLLHIFNSVVILYLLECPDTSYSIIFNICVFVCIFKHLCIKHWVKLTHWSSILGSYCCLLIALYKSCFENWNKSQFINWYHLNWEQNKRLMIRNLRIWSNPFTKQDCDPNHQQYSIKNDKNSNKPTFTSSAQNKTLIFCPSSCYQLKSSQEN